LAAKEQKAAEPLIALDSPLSGAADGQAQGDPQTLAETKKLAKL